MPSSKFILWIDLETTGSDATSDIIEVGAVLTDNDLNTVGEFNTTVQPTWNQLEKLRANPKVLGMHTKNGLLAELDHQDSPNVAVVDQVMNGWLNTYYTSLQHLPLGGSGVSHFDRQFIRRLMPIIDARLTYWAYDVGVLRRTRELFGLPPLSIPEDKTHRALDDIKGHIAEMKFYRSELLFARRKSLAHE